MRRRARTVRSALGYVTLNTGQAGLDVVGIRHRRDPTVGPSLHEMTDPIARDLVLTLDRRARRRAWALDSL